jgi:hypothetical protein
VTRARVTTLTPRSTHGIGDHSHVAVPPPQTAARDPCRLYVIVNGLSIGQWLLLRNEPIEDVDPRVLELIWPTG